MNPSPSPTTKSREPTKIVLLGEGSVGKTSLIMRYIGQPFSSEHVATLQAACHSKRITVQQQRLDLQIWDTAGQEQYHALGPLYYRDAAGALLVYDITDEDSFLRIQDWARELRSMLGPLPIVIVGNKSDLERERVVPIDEAKQFAQEWNQKLLKERSVIQASLPTIEIEPQPSSPGLEGLGYVGFLETSAKRNEGVDLAFLELTRRILNLDSTKKRPRSGRSQTSLSRSGSSLSISAQRTSQAVASRRSLTIVDGTSSLEQEPASKSNCCIIS